MHERRTRKVIKQLGTGFYPIYILDSLKREAARTSYDLATSNPGGTPKPALAE